jgi:hypothetical protein
MQAPERGNLSYRRQKMKVASGRAEKRWAMAVPLHIKSLDRTDRAETAVTENMSRFGARILVENTWEMGERVLIQSSGIQCAARVIYRQKLRNGGIAIGVHLDNRLEIRAGKWSEGLAEIPRV